MPGIVRASRIGFPQCGQNRCGVLAFIHDATVTVGVATRVDVDQFDNAIDDGVRQTKTH
jgi:hypothetical protein